MSPVAKHSRKSVNKKKNYKEIEKVTGTRKFSVLAVLVVFIWLGLSGVAGPIFGKLSEVQENDNSAFLPSSAESSKVSEEILKFTASDSLPALVVVTGDLNWWISLVLLKMLLDVHITLGLMILVEN